MRRIVAVSALCALSVSGLDANQKERPTPQSPGVPALSYLCTNVAGAIIAAPDWKPEADGARGQSVLIHYRGDKEISEVTWKIGSDAPYYEVSGIGSAMRGGFAVVVFAEDYVESYVYNAGTTELLYSSTRAGSVLLPNSMKSFRGRCEPAGNRR